MKIGDVAYKVNSSEYVYITGGFIDKDDEFVVTEYLSFRVSGSCNTENRLILGFARHKDRTCLIQECNQKAATGTKALFETLINNSWFNKKETVVRFIGEV